MDTAVSRSTDNGATWSYTVANYLGDNGNRFNRDSTAFIDPALLADGDTIYLACDLLPAGLAVANAARYPAKAGSTGYDTNGNLLLALSTTSVNGLSVQQHVLLQVMIIIWKKKPMRHLSPVMRSRITVPVKL